MKLQFAILFLVFCLVIPEWAQAEDSHELILLSTPEQRLIQAPGLKRYSLSGTAIRILPLAGSTNLLIKALGPGRSDLMLFLAQGSRHLKIQVKDANPKAGGARDPQKECTDGLATLTEVQILSCPKGFCLEGQIQSAREAFRVESLKERCSQWVDDLTDLNPELLRDSLVRLKTYLAHAKKGDDLRVEEHYGQAWVRGALGRNVERSALEKGLKSVFAPVKMDIDSLPDDAPTVHFNVFLLELKRNRFRSLGLGWPGATEGAFRVSASKIQNLLELDLTLNALEGEGSARVLSNPELVVRAPGEAELFSGGELPIYSRNQFQTSTSWKPFGLQLKLQVQKATPQKVRLEISTEVSHVDSTLTNEHHVPGLSSSRMKTQVDAAFGRPLLLSGLLQQDTRDAVKGLPFLSQIPILGKLFGSEDFLEERSELVAILLPNWTPPAPPLERMGAHLPRGNLPLPRNWISPAEERTLRADANFPWNALE